MGTKRTDPEDEVAERVAVNLTRLRVKHGSTQESLAEASETDISSIQRFEGAQSGPSSNPTIRVLARIAACLGADVGELFKRGTNPIKQSRGRPRRQQT